METWCVSAGVQRILQGSKTVYSRWTSCPAKTQHWSFSWSSAVHWSLITNVSVNRRKGRGLRQEDQSIRSDGSTSWWRQSVVTSAGFYHIHCIYMYLHVCLHVSINHWKYLQNQTLPLKAVRLGAKHWCSLTLTCRPALKDKTFIRLLCHLVTRVMLLVVTSAPSEYLECRTRNKQNKTTCRRRSPLGPPWATALHWAVSNEHAAGSETVLRVLRPL